MIIKKIIKFFPYNLPKEKKTTYFIKGIKELTSFHKKNCKEYRKILNLFNFRKYNKLNLSDYPFLPTKIFKKFDLTLRVLNKKSPDFLPKLALVEISSKTGFFVDILILGDPTTLSL